MDPFSCRYSLRQVLHSAWIAIGSTICPLVALVAQENPDALVSGATKSLKEEFFAPFLAKLKEVPAAATPTFLLKCERQTETSSERKAWSQSRSFRRDREDHGLFPMELGYGVHCDLPRNLKAMPNGRDGRVTILDLVARMHIQKDNISHLWDSRVADSSQASFARQQLPLLNHSSLSSSDEEGGTRTLIFIESHQQPYTFPFLLLAQPGRHHQFPDQQVKPGDQWDSKSALHIAGLGALKLHGQLSFNRVVERPDSPAPLLELHFRGEWSLPGVTRWNRHFRGGTHEEILLLDPDSGVVEVALMESHILLVQLDRHGAAMDTPVHMRGASHRIGASLTAP